MPSLLDILTIFDWITPTVAGIQDVVYGPSHTFLIPEASGYSGREILNLLHDHGVKTWGAMIVNDTLMITVRQSQAKWGDYLLQRAAVPLFNPIASEGEIKSIEGETTLNWGWGE